MLSFSQQIGRSCFFHWSGFKQQPKLHLRWELIFMWSLLSVCWNKHYNSPEASGRWCYIGSISRTKHGRRLYTVAVSYTEICWIFMWIVQFADDLGFQIIIGLGNYAGFSCVVHKFCLKTKSALKKITHRPFSRQTCHSGKWRGVNNKMTDGWIPFICVGFRFLIFLQAGSLSHCHVLLGHLKWKEPLLMLSVTPVLFLLWHVMMSAVEILVRDFSPLCSPGGTWTPE